MIQSHSADDSLIVWTLQHSSTQGARFLQSQFCQVAFRTDICPADPAAKELIAFNHVLASDFWWLVSLLRVSHYPYLLTSEVYLASKTCLVTVVFPVIVTTVPDIKTSKRKGYLVQLFHRIWSFMVGDCGEVEQFLLFQAGSRERGTVAT